MRRLLGRGICVVAVAVAANLAAPALAAAGGGCPAGSPTYAGDVTSPREAIPQFAERKASVEELYSYFELVDSQSDRVTVGEYATSGRGAPLIYALTGDADDVANPGPIVAANRALRDPRVTDSAEAATLADESKAIVWYTANVHGDEPSGAEAAASILHDIADRTDCEAQRLRDELLVGIIPVQNPDGRVRGFRTNRYYFDMNRDWFARTQPETDGKMDLLADYPPVLFVDAHEMGGRRYFFPPNADPIHHEISSEAVSWINDIYGAALQDEFDSRRDPSDPPPVSWDYFNYSIYDLFYMGYGDTVPSTAFTAAGMTFEKGSSDPYPRKEREQRVAGWTSLQQAAIEKDRILGELYDANVDALAQGEAGELEPNEVVQPENEVRFEVPDRTIRNYFIPGDAHYSDVANLLDRLLSTGVEVHRLTAPLEVSDFTRYGRDAGPETLPAGTYWVPMAQPQKHWIEALLGEESYVPFPYFYDVTAWSNPLLMNLEDAGFSAAEVDPAASPVTEPPAGEVEPGASSHYTWEGDTGKAVAAAIWLVRKGATVERLLEAEGGLGEGAFVAPATDAAKLAAAAEKFTLRISPGGPGPMPEGEPVEDRRLALVSNAGESRGHFRYMLKEVWRMPFDSLEGTKIKRGALENRDVGTLLVTGTAVLQLDKAAKQVRSFVRDGGVFIGWNRFGATGGTAWAVENGLTSARFKRAPGLQVPGSMFRIDLDDSSPLTLAAPDFAYQFNLGEDILKPTTTGTNVATYPESEPDWFVSGFARGTGPVRGSSALVDEELGDGRVVLFSGEPNYRAFTEGTQHLIANALAYPRSEFNSAARDVSSPAAATAVAAAQLSVPPAIGPGQPLRLEVPAEQGARALEVVRGLGVVGVTLATAGDSAILSIPNPRELDLRELEYGPEVLPALEAAGIEVLSGVL